METIEEFKQMEAQLQQLSDEYAAGKDTGMTDAEYDHMFATAKAFAEKNNITISPESILAKVGDDRVSGFAKITHKTPMLSIEDVFEHDSEDVQERYSEVVDWYKKVCDTLGYPMTDVTIESKIDGCAAAVVYDNGKLKYVATRGNGTVGDDITANVSGIDGIPVSLHGGRTDRVEIRGEIVMYNSDFEELNAAREAAGLKTFANPRNTVAGTIKSKDPAEIEDRKLHFIPHTLTDDSFNISTASLWLGSERARYTPVCAANRLDLDAESHGMVYITRPEELADAIHAARTYLTTTPYNTDGLVVKIANYNDCDKLGCTSRAPRWACALKFLPEQKTAELLGIDFQVGRTGVITPVARMTPTYVSGSTVSNATLHNQDQINRLGVNIGDTVVIEKSGEIIPAVVRVEKKGPNEGALDIMAHLDGKCPECGAPLAKDGVAIRCTGDDCPGVVRASINYFFSKNGLNILGLGEQFVKALMEQHGVTTPADVFCLTEDMLAATKTDDGNGVSKALGASAAHKIKIQLNVAMKEPLWKWLTACGIPLIGKVTAKKLTRKYNTFRGMMTGSIDDFEKIVGPAAALSLASCLSGAVEMLDIIGALDQVKSDNWFNPEAEQPTEASCAPMLGMSICVTGKLSRERDFFQETIEKCGGKFQTSVNGKTTYLLAGEGGGGKRKKAESLGVEIIDEARFWELTRG